MRFLSLEKLINLHDGYRRQFKIDQLQFLLIQEQGQLYLVESRCPHREHPLLEASITGDMIQCPLHGYRFSLTSGALLRAGEEPCRGLRVYLPIYSGNEVGIQLPEE